MIGLFVPLWLFLYLHVMLCMNRGFFCQCSGGTGGCNGWVHPTCVGLTEESAADIGEYTCRLCKVEASPAKKRLKIIASQDVIRRSRIGESTPVAAESGEESDDGSDDGGSVESSEEEDKEGEDEEEEQEEGEGDQEDDGNEEDDDDEEEIEDDDDEAADGQEASTAEGDAGDVGDGDDDGAEADPDEDGYDDDADAASDKADDDHNRGGDDDGDDGDDVRAGAKKQRLDESEADSEGDDVLNANFDFDNPDMAAGW